MREQLRMAANGQINGTAGDWPLLMRELKDLGYAVTKYTPANVVAQMAKHYLKRGEDWGVEEAVCPACGEQIDDAGRANCLCPACGLRVCEGTV